MLFVLAGFWHDAAVLIPVRLEEPLKEVPSACHIIYDINQ